MPRVERKKIIGACFVKVSTAADLGRLSCALERAPFPLFAFKHGQNLRLAAQADLFMGTPIFYYIDVESAGEFLAYRNVGEYEDIRFLDSANNPSYIYSPIIRVGRLPKAFERKEEFEDKFLAVEVEDLPSLAKVGTYKILFEEPPLPLFCFKNGNEWVLGAFARINDYEEASLFFYTRIDNEPTAGFLRYSPSKASETAFSRKIDEHGFVYMKIVRLAEKHPLVQF